MIQIPNMRLAVQEQILSDVQKKKDIKEVADREPGWTRLNISESRWKLPTIVNTKARFRLAEAS